MSECIYYGGMEFNLNDDDILILYKINADGIFLYDFIIDDDMGWIRSSCTDIEDLKNSWRLIELKKGNCYTFLNKEDGAEWARIQVMETKLGKEIM